MSLVYSLKTPRFSGSSRSYDSTSGRRASVLLLCFAVIKSKSCAACVKYRFCMSEDIARDCTWFYFVLYIPSVVVCETRCLPRFPSACRIRPTNIFFM